MSYIEPLTVRVADAAKMIGFRENYVYDLLAKGELTRIKIGRATVIEVAEIKRWIEKHKASCA